MADGGLLCDPELEKHRHPHSIARQEALPVGIRRIQNNSRPIGPAASCFPMDSEDGLFLGSTPGSQYVVIAGSKRRGPGRIRGRGTSSRAEWAQVFRAVGLCTASVL